MTALIKFRLFFVISILLFLSSCETKEKKSKETIIEGKANIYVDESIFPIVEDEQIVFETEYKAKLNVIAKSENEIIIDLFYDTAKIAILTRSLTESEIKQYKNKKITPKITPFAYDAIALIKNEAANDSIIALEDIVNFIRGNWTPNIKGLIFDNPNSSAMRFLSDVVGLPLANKPKVFSFKTTADVIKYVSENDGMVGVVGMNWILQPPIELQPEVEKVKVLGVKGLNATNYYYPTQDNLAQNLYPMSRRLYFINCQGYTGLGMGFASFISGERGQRIILKSGLVPEHFPSRKVVIRNTVTKSKN